MSLAEEFIPRDWQEQIIGNPKKDIPEDKTKYKVVVAHRKSGKTVMALMYLFMLAYKCKDAVSGAMRVPRFTYIGPTYKQAKDIAWDLLKDIVPESCLLKRPNETQMEIRLTNRVIINIKGADKEDSLRGPGLYYALLDEYASMKPNIWETIIQPELASTGGGAMFIGTPAGRDHFYELFKRGRDNLSDDWRSWSLPASKPLFNFHPDTIRGDKLLSPGFLEGARMELTEKFYNQEYEVDFIDNAGMVFDRVDENVIDEFREYPEAGHLYRIGFDPAIREDWSVFSVLDLVDRKFKYIYRTNKIDIELLMERTQNIVNSWTTNAGRPEVVMDTTGMGDPIYDLLAGKGVPILPVKFGAANKRKLVDGLAILLNKDEIKIPRLDWLIDELKDYRYEKTPTGKYTYGAPQGKHDDGVTSLMLACFQLPPLFTPNTDFGNPLDDFNYKPNFFTGY